MDLRGTPVRLRRLRAAMNELSGGRFPTAKAFARFLGIKYRRYNNWENDHPLPIKQAERICRKCPGVNALWLYEGDPSRLSWELATALGEAPRPPSPLEGLRMLGKPQVRT
jgi:hypothetical protein